MQVISRNSKDHEHMHGIRRRHEGQVEQPGEALQIARTAVRLEYNNCPKQNLPYPINYCDILIRNGSPSLQFNPNFFEIKRIST
jgi:hypothetical protein